MTPDIINKAFFELGQTLVRVKKVGPQISEHIYPILLDKYEPNDDFKQSYPEYEEDYNNLVYLNGLYSSILYE